MKNLFFAVLVMNGVRFWVPCERGAVWCPHFEPEIVGYEVKLDTVSVDLSSLPCPSAVVEGVLQ